MTKRSTATKDKALLFFATCGPIGNLPFAPGTYGSAFSCVVLYLFPAVFTNIIVVAVFTICAVAALNGLAYEGTDPGYIIIDECAGMLVTMVGHPVTFVNILIGFCLFRFFDIVKPFPIRRVEGFPKGYGIVADDVVAGIFANLALVVWGKIRP